MIDNEPIYILPEIQQICDKAGVNIKQVYEIHACLDYIEFYCYDWKDGQPYLNESGNDAEKVVVRILARTSDYNAMR